MGEPFDLLENNLCCGCGCCVAVCKQEALRMEINKDGFFRPKLDQEKCNDCGICKQVCPNINSPQLEDVQSDKPFALWAQNSPLRVSASSGGAALVLSLSAVQRDCSVVGAVYNKDFRLIEHVVADSSDDVFLFKGSKYSQSNFSTAIKESIMDTERKHIVFGTPCQISGARNLINKKGLDQDYLLVDFFCHGVPSYYLWWSFIDQVSNKIGPIKHLELRNKQEGWHSFKVFCTGEKGNYSKPFDEALFGRFFLSNYCFQEVCYQCPYGKLSAADLRLGDYWGKDFADDVLGTSIAIPLTKKGFELIEKTKELEYQSMPISSVRSSQDIKRQTIRKPADNDSVLEKLSKGGSLNQIYKEHLRKKYISVGIRQRLFKFARKILPNDIILVLRGIRNFIGGKQ